MNDSNSFARGAINTLTRDMFIDFNAVSGGGKRLKFVDGKYVVDSAEGSVAFDTEEKLVEYMQVQLGAKK